MFKIARGQLILDHYNAKDVIDKIIQKEIENVNDYKIAKLLWFIDNYDSIINPVTTLTWGDMTLDIHPGHIRLIAARLLQKKTIDSIILYSLDSYLHQISFGAEDFRDNYLYKQPLSDYWQVSTKHQKDFLDCTKNKSQVYWDHWENNYESKYGLIEDMLKTIKDKTCIFESVFKLTKNL